MSEAAPAVPVGLCQCGCGQKTETYKTSRKSKGHVRGEPCRFLPRHWVHTPERSATISAGLMGHHTSDETKAKIGAARRAADHMPVRQQGGYLLVWAPDHPDANCYGRILEHRLVAEKMIGRRLTADEAVHHVNFKRDDNRPENLRVLTFAEHSAPHRRLDNERRK